MEIMTESAKQSIEIAYDSFKKEEFLKRIYSFIEESVDLAVRNERFELSAKHFHEKLMSDIASGAKTKPGRRAGEKDLFVNEEGQA